MADRTTKFSKLPDRLKQVDTALTELNEVITGGAFDHDKIWGATAEDNIVTYMKSLSVDAKLSTEITKLLKDLPGTSAVKSAIDAATGGLQQVLDEIRKQAQELVGDRLTALTNLITPHAGGAYDYHASDDHFGYFPAITGVINAAAGGNADLTSILGPLQQAADVAAAADAMVDFVDYATASVNLLTTSLTV